MNWHRQVPALLSAEPYCWPQLALARAWRGWAHDSDYERNDELLKLLLRQLSTTSRTTTKGLRLRRRFTTMVTTTITARTTIMHASLCDSDYD